MAKEELNPEQMRAVRHVEGPLLVLAGAGSGKTRIVTYRIAHLLQLGVPASAIVALTFTNKAAEEMRHRIQHLAQHWILSCTFHSLCARILREIAPEIGYGVDFVIYDEEDRDKLIKQCLMTLNYSEDKTVVKKIHAQISYAKNSLTNWDEVTEQGDLFSSVYKLYQTRLKEYNAMDFDDLLFLTVQHFKQNRALLENFQNRWAFILIDEYQDTNMAQYSLIQLLSEKHRNVFAVGDPDQSIYSWRGANIQNILNFTKDYPGAQVLSLEQNYRSHNVILQAANALIQNNEDRYEKNLWSSRESGEKIGLYVANNEYAEADFVVRRLLTHQRQHNVNWNDCVIFYRTNFQSRIFEDVLLRERIPYLVVGGVSFYQRREVKDILAFLRMVVGGDFLSFARTINLPKRGIGENTLSKLQLLAEESKQDLLSLCKDVIEKKTPLKLSAKQQEGLQEYLSIIHALKEKVEKGFSLPDLIKYTIERSRYAEYLEEEKETAHERKENLNQLVAKAHEWQKNASTDSKATLLSSFLEELSLKSAHDETSSHQSYVRLMTLHNGKGLEFSVVALVGLEEDLLPHLNSKGTRELIEEERRLCYVGMTRAKDYLYLSAARSRFLWGATRSMTPSRFLAEIPRQHTITLHAGPSFSFPEQDTSFTSGDSVIHADFGVGMIQRVYTTSLGTTYDVQFGEKVRTLVAKYAKLTPASLVDS